MATRLLLVASFCALATSPGAGQQPTPPIIDMHVHAPRADSQGPPPLGICPGNVFPVIEQSLTWEETFMAWLKKPPCSTPIWSPLTDREVMERTLAV